MKKRFAAILAGVLALSVALAGCGGSGSKAKEEPKKEDPAASQPKAEEKVTIEYWQYDFASKKKLMDELITEFQTKNPNITVKHVTFPYEQYNEKVAATVSAGRGPDVINLYYGWLPLYVDSGYLQPLPEDAFPASKIDKEFFPLVQAAKMDGKYYVLPTAVRTLAMLYNADLLKEAGISGPPKTWDELVDYAKKTTKRDANGQLQQVGFYFNVGGQGHNWFREVLIRQAGGEPQSADLKKINWSSEAGIKAFKWWVQLQTVHKVGEIGFMTDDVTAFKAGKAAMNIDGSFRVGSLKDLKFEWASAPLPVGPNGKPATMSSFWANGITKKAQGKEKEAAVKFLQFLTQPDVMERWTKAIGELPARPEVAQKFKDDPKLKGFVEGLPYAHATFFVDEKKDRQALIDAVDEVTLKGKDPAQALKDAEKQVQALFDSYWSKRK
ncbi:MAG: extracellular solute-binding protein [Bacillota bacterium]